MTSDWKADIVPRLGATLLSLGFLFGIYLVFDRYDWGYPHVKFLCFSVLFAAIVSLQLLKSRSRASETTLWVEVALLAVFLQLILIFQIAPNLSKATSPPASDIGYTTVHAVKVLVNEGENPYSRTDINSAQKDLAPEYHGFHYGPFMIAGYLPSAFLGDYAYKLMSTIFVLLTVLLLILFVSDPKITRLENVANALFVVVAYLMAGRFWYELFREGVNDVFHIMLLLAGFLFLKKGRIFLAGLLTGLSISAKFAPGVFAVPFMPLRQRDFWLGLIVGLLPYLPFYIWDAAGVWRNTFWLRTVIPFNSTSLFSITPPSLHWIFGAVMVTSCLIAFWWALKNELDFELRLVGFVLLAIITDVTQKQVHLNHLFWFFPFLALLFLSYRDRLAGTFISEPKASLP